MILSSPFNGESFYQEETHSSFRAISNTLNLPIFYGETISSFKALLTAIVTHNVARFQREKIPVSKQFLRKSLWPTFTQNVA